MRSDRFVRGNFRGSATALKWARKELLHLMAVLKFTRGRAHVVQAGGNLGVWPHWLARRFKLVTTFEPDPENFACLVWNAREKNIRAFNAALGECAGHVRLSKVRRDGKADSHAGCVHVDPDGPTPVEMMTVDAVQMEACDLIYLDVEGYELHALRGATATIARFRPVVACEINKHLASYGVTPEEVYAFMAEHGYRLGPKFGIDQVFLPEERAS